MSLNLLLLHVLDSFGEGLLKVLELDQVRAKVDPAACAFTLLCCSLASSNTELGQTVDVRPAKGGDLPPNNVLELLAGQHSGWLSMRFTSLNLNVSPIAHVNGLVEVLDAIKDCLQQVNAATQLS